MLITFIYHFFIYQLMLFCFNIRLFTSSVINYSVVWKLYHVLRVILFYSNAKFHLIVYLSVSSFYLINITIYYLNLLIIKVLIAVVFPSLSPFKLRFNFITKKMNHLQN